MESDTASSEDAGKVLFPEKGSLLLVPLLMDPLEGVIMISTHFNREDLMLYLPRTLCVHKVLGSFPSKSVFLCVYVLLIHLYIIA